MNKFILLIVLVLFTNVSLACSCRTNLASQSPEKAIDFVRENLNAAEEVLRVKVLEREENQGVTTYKVEVIEYFKAASPLQKVQTLTTGPTSCRLYLGVNEEWLLFVDSKKHFSDCHGSQLLAEANAARLGGSSDTYWLVAQYRTGARWLELIRSISVSHPPRK